ncbi:MAG: hypothetical protein DRI54_04510 [Bacteroidetes bacterium]|nr:MAG: hypothetical protein DRI54_04510 [Bacteroidota bacterium]
MKNLIYIPILLFVFSCCTEQQVVDQQAEADKLMEVSRQWADSKSTEEYLKYWADDAVFISSGQPTMRGKDEILKMLEGSVNIPGFKVDWEPLEAVVSKSGDLGYIIENLSVSVNDSLGNSITTYSKAVTIWKKQADGNWLNVVDINSEDPSITSLK